MFPCYACQVAEAVEALGTPGDNPQDEGDRDEDMDGDGSAAAAAEALRGVALLTSALLAEHGRGVPEALLGAAAALHDNALLVRWSTFRV